MKRRSFLGLLGLAPAVPVLAKADDHLGQIKKAVKENFPPVEPVHYVTRSDWYPESTVSSMMIITERRK